MGDGFKPPHAALAEDRRGERCGKGAHDASGGGEGDDRCLRVESIEATSEPGYSKGSGRSLAGAHLLARRCPAQRRRDPRLRLSQGTWEGADMVPRSGFGGARGSAPGGRNREELSTVAAVAGGPSRSSDEAPVTGVEPRGRLIRDGSLGQLVERPGGAR